MNSEKAIKEIICLINSISFPTETVKALEWAIKALRTHTPKKPIEKYADGCLVCPVCYGVLEVDYRCPMCGQLIDWEDEDDR